MLFDKFYLAKVGLQFFDKKATTAPFSKKVTMTETYAFLPIPFFKDEFAEKKSASFFTEGFNMREAQANEVSFRDISWEWAVTKESNKPDVLRVTFYATYD